MGHQSCIVRHRPTTLPGALSRTRAHQRPGRADKTRSPPSRSSLTTYILIALVGRRPSGSIGTALRSIVLFHDDSIVENFWPIFTPNEFGESPICPRKLTAGPIDRSTLRVLNVLRILNVESRKSINEFVHGQQIRATGILNKHWACESISEFEGCSRVLEEPSEPSTSSTLVAKLSFGSIDAPIPCIVDLPVRSYSIRFVKSIWRNNRINRPTGIIVDLEKRFLIIARLVLSFHRLSNEQTITRVRHVSIFPSGSINQFFQPAIPKTIKFYETIHFFSSSWSRGSLILVTASFRAAAMTFRRRTSFR